MPIYTSRGEPELTSGSRTYPAALTYDAQGRRKTLKTWQNFAAGTETNITEWTYDGYRGWLTNKVYGTSPGPQYTYTAGGALATRLWARGITTTYANDTAGMLYSVNYSDGTAGITNVYDRVGRLLEAQHDGIVTTNFYNGAGLLLGEFHTGGALGGLAVTNDYDSLLRRSSSRAAGYGGSINSYTYDTANRLATVGDGTNSAAYSYLANSRLVSQILHRQSASTKMTTSKQYDLLNRLLSISSVASATNTLPFHLGYNYNKANQRVRVSHGDGTYWIYGYDALGQLISGRKHWSDGTPVEGQQHEYLFDDIGNRKSTGEGGDIAGGNLRPATYSRNLLNQITSRGVPNEVDIIGTSTATNDVTINSSPADYRRGSYFREELTVSNGSGPAWTAVTVAADTTKTGNILTPPATQTFGYDADGNLTNDLVWTYVWDGENRLKEILPLTNNPSGSKKWLTFQYDYRGRRIGKWAADWTNSTWAVRVNNRFLYDGWNLLGELNATNNNLIRGHIWGLDLSGGIQGAGGVGGLIAINDPANGTHFCAYDGNGNVVGTVKNDGTVTSIIEYDPFGQVKRRTGTFAELNPFLFSTKYFDAEVGLSYYGYRYYAATFGRWINEDIVDELGFDRIHAESAFTARNADINLYAAFANNVPNYFDATGLVVETGWDVFSVFAGVVSFGCNVTAGNYAGAFADVLGVGYDLLATATPGWPGGAGVAQLQLTRTGQKLVTNMYDAADGASNAKTLIRFAIRTDIDAAHHLIPHGGPPLSWAGGLRREMDALRARAAKAKVDLHAAYNGVSLKREWHSKNTLDAAYYQRVVDHFRGAKTEAQFKTKMEELANALLKESGKLK